MLNYYYLSDEWNKVGFLMICPMIENRFREILNNKQFFS